MATHRITSRDTAPPECRGGWLAIGNFDGVHRGHAALVTRLRQRAEKDDTVAVAVTFDPHPLAVLRPQQFQPTLTTIQDRADYLHARGADHVVIIETDRSLLDLEARPFFDRVVVGSLAARGLVEGPNFGFGKDRRGTVDTLAAFCAEAGLDLDIVPPVHMDGGIVSSSRIRQALCRGDLTAARRWLGHAYRLRGVVVPGHRRGQSIGFPTANLDRVTTLIPGDGVYAVRVTAAGATFAGAANVGPNPTFGETTRKIEVHVIGFQGDLLGQELVLDFVERIRDTKRFASVDELRQQIREDVAKCARIVAGDQE